MTTEMSSSPQSLMRSGGVELLCELSSSPHEPLAQNALWAIKNLVFHAPDLLKTSVMTVFGWPRLRE